MHVSQLVFSWPREAQYSCDPTFYEGGAIEDYDFEFGSLPLHMGEVRQFEGKGWIVAQVESYSPTDGTDNGFSVVVLTLDGQAAARAPWAGAGERVMYTCISPDDVMFGLPEHPEAVPAIGHEDRALPGWAVTSIQEFEPAGQGTYDRVLVCWCAAAAAMHQPQREPVSAHGKG